MSILAFSGAREAARDARRKSTYNLSNQDLKYIKQIVMHILATLAASLVGSGTPSTFVLWLILIYLYYRQIQSLQINIDMPQLHQVMKFAQV